MSTESCRDTFFQWIWLRFLKTLCILIATAQQCRSQRASWSICKLLCSIEIQKSIGWQTTSYLVIEFALFRLNHQLNLVGYISLPPPCTLPLRTATSLLRLRASFPSSGYIQRHTRTSIHLHQRRLALVDGVVYSHARRLSYRLWSVRAFHSLFAHSPSSSNLLSSCHKYFSFLPFLPPSFHSLTAFGCICHEEYKLVDQNSPASTILRPLCQ